VGKKVKISLLKKVVNIQYLLFFRGKENLPISLPPLLGKSISVVAGFIHSFFL